MGNRQPAIGNNDPGRKSTIANCLLPIAFKLTIADSILHLLLLCPNSKFIILLPGKKKFLFRFIPVMWVCMSAVLLSVVKATWDMQDLILLLMLSTAIFCILVIKCDMSAILPMPGILKRRGAKQKIKSQKK